MCKITIEMEANDPRLPAMMKLLADASPSAPSQSAGVSAAAPIGAVSPAMTTSPTPAPAASPPVTMPVAATVAPTPTTAGDAITIDNVNTALQGAITRVKASGAKAILATFGVTRAGDLRPDQWAAAIAALNG